MWEMLILSGTKISERSFGRLTLSGVFFRSLFAIHGATVVVFT
jgi:hypothetical protein